MRNLPHYKQILIKFYMHLIALFIFCFLFTFSWMRYQSFQSQAFDLGIFNQAAWLISEGKDAFVTIIDRGILADHLAYNFYFLGLIYKLFPSPVFLLFFQALTFAASVYVIYLLSIFYKLDAGKRLLILVSYAIHPVVFNSNLFDFHFESFAFLLILLALYLVQVKKYVLFYISIFFALGCKESVSLALACLAIYLILSRRSVYHGVILLILSLIYFLTAYFYILPNLSDNIIAGMDRFPSLGKTPKEIIVSILTNPWQLIPLIAWKSGFKYLFKFFLPFIYAYSRRSFLALIALSPLLLNNLTSASDLQRSLNFQYNIIPLAFLVIMALEGLADKKIANKHFKFYFLFTLILFIVNFTRVLRDHDCSYPHPWCRSSEQVRTYQEAVTRIPRNCDLIAPSHLIPQLSQRTKIWMLEEAALAKLDQSTCLITSDFDPGWLASLELNQSAGKKAKRLGFKKSYEQDGLKIFLK